MRILIDNGAAFIPEGIQLLEESKDSIMAAMRLGFEAAKLKNKEIHAEEI